MISGALGAEREHDLGDPERAERRLVGAAAELLGLLVVELERGDVAEDGAVDVSVADERADPAVADEALRVDDEPVAARGERRQRLEREVGRG